MLAVVLCIAACRPPPPRPIDRTPTPVEVPRALYHAAAERGAAVFEVDSALSTATILVRRAGPLARFGHDHVVLARNPEGLVLLSPNSPRASRADLRIAVRDLAVDPPAERARFRLETTPDAADIAATRSNLLKTVLVAEQWPDVYVQIRWAEGALPQVRLNAKITLNAQTRDITFPAKIRVEGDEMQIRGSFTLQQSHWGIEPFSALGGALRVADTVEVEFELFARRTVPDGAGQ